MNIKRFFAVGICASVLLTAAFFASCKDEKQENTDTGSDTLWSAPEGTEIHYDDVDVTQYVFDFRYKGMSIMLEDGVTRAEALWQRICTVSELEAYPEEKVDYYFNQMKKSYMSSVGYNQADYEMLLKDMETDELKMKDEARTLVKQDLIYKYIVEAEGISLTDKEKSENFDKYVKRLAEEFKKSEEQVAADMPQYIYDAMLYDKVTEFLILNNTFVTE